MDSTAESSSARAATREPPRVHPPEPVRVAPLPPRAWVTDVLLVIMATLWGVNFVVVKYGTDIITPIAFNGARMLLASVVLVAITARGGVWPRRRDLLLLLALGLIGNGLYQWLFVEGVARVRAGSASILLAGVPAMIAILGRIRGTEHVGARGVGGIALSIVGIGLIVYGGQRSPSDGSTFTGALLVLGAAMCWAAYTVMLKPLTHRVNGLNLHALTMWSGTALLVGASLPAMWAVPWNGVPALGWLAIAYSGLGALVLAYIFWYRGVRILGPTRAAMYANVQPAIALVVAWLLLNEVPTPWQITGAALILSGIVLVRGGPAVLLAPDAKS